MVGVCHWCSRNAALVERALCAACVEREHTFEQARRAVRLRYAVRPDDPARLPMTLAEASALVSAYLDRAITFDQEETLEAVTWWYVPHKWIGCSGYIVDKADGRVFELGSCHSEELVFWAQARGALREACELIVDRVANRDAAIEGLAQILRFPGDEIRERLGSLPARFPPQKLWFQLVHLRDLIDAGVMDCRFEAVSD